MRGDGALATGTGPSSPCPSSSATSTATTAPPCNDTLGPSPRLTSHCPQLVAPSGHPTGQVRLHAGPAGAWPGSGRGPCANQAQRVSPRARLMWLVPDSPRAPPCWRGAAGRPGRHWYDHAWWLLAALAARGHGVRRRGAAAGATACTAGRPPTRRSTPRPAGGRASAGSRRCRGSRPSTTPRVPVSRLFGLATVTVTTASAAGALEIEGLDRDRARRARGRADPQGRHRPGRRHVSRAATDPRARPAAERSGSGSTRACSWSTRSGS